MNKFCILLALVFSVIGNSAAFVPIARSAPSTRVVAFAEGDDSQSSFSSRTAERGVSVDQDGKSNVWAIEPKMEISTKSSEEKTQTALIAGGGLAVFAVIAGLALTNLPDPNQF